MALFDFFIFFNGWCDVGASYWGPWFYLLQSWNHWILHPLCQTCILPFFCAHSLEVNINCYTRWISLIFKNQGMTFRSFTCLYSTGACAYCYHVLDRALSQKLKFPSSLYLPNTIQKEYSPHTCTPGVLSGPKPIVMFQSMFPHTPALTPTHTHPCWDRQLTSFTNFCYSISYLLRAFSSTEFQV